MPNPLTSLKLLLRKDTAAIITTGSIYYTVYGTLAASLSVQGIRIYQLNYLQAGMPFVPGAHIHLKLGLGLTYIPCGIGGMLSGYGTGKPDSPLLPSAKHADLKSSQGNCSTVTIGWLPKSMGS